MSLFLCYLVFIDAQKLWVLLEILEIPDKKQQRIEIYFLVIMSQMYLVLCQPFQIMKDVHRSISVFPDEMKVIVPQICVR